jgi:hypothetical protein
MGGVNAGSYVPLGKNRENNPMQSKVYARQTGRSPFTVTLVPERVCGQ